MPCVPGPAILESVDGGELFAVCLQCGIYFNDDLPADWEHNGSDHFRLDIERVAPNGLRFPSDRVVQSSTFADLVQAKEPIDEDWVSWLDEYNARISSWITEAT